MTAATRARRLVLVVDDQAPSRFAKVQILRRAHFEVCEAATGLDALRLANDRHPDLVLLDVHLPDINGMEVCRRLKAVPRPVPVSVVQISATAVTDADRASGLSNGADAYLTEPVSSEVLIATMNALDRVRQLDIALAEANRSKDEFIAILSHELRTPLNVMLGRIAQLRRSDLGDEARSAALDALERSARLQWRLIDELLDVSRIEKGKLELQTGPVDLADIARAVVEAMSPRAAANGIELRADLAPAPVTADAGRIQQVIANLVGNALQFTRSGGRVEVTVRSDDTEARVEVADSGIGIERKLLPHVFERFRQSGDPTHRAHGGLGLGLAIAAGIAESHGGSLKAFSEGPGRGATFTLSIPR